MNIYTYKRIVDCPYCDMTADRKTVMRDHFPVGTPYRTCPKCGKVYFDPGYQEDAIAWFTDKGRELRTGVLFAALFYTWALIAYSIECSRTRRISLLGFISLLIFALVADIHVVMAAWYRIRAKEYHQKKVDELEGRSGELPPEVAESMKRMSDRAYLDTLKAHKIWFPEYFYQRLGEGAVGTFVEPEGILEAKKIREF